MVSSPVSSRFVGRQAELGALQEWRRHAFARHGLMVLVSGEAGIGKSRLLREFGKSLTHGRALSVSAAAFPYVGRPYGPVLDALDELLNHIPDALRNATALQATLATILPRLQRPAASAATLPSADKHSLFQSIASAFGALAEKRSTVVCIEDIHWADQGTLELLHYITRFLESARLLFVLSYRTDELHRAHPLILAIAKLSASPNVQQIGLQPLSPEETRALIQSTTGARAALSHQVEFDIERRSEGNPFFVEELLKSAVDRASQPRATNDLPLSIRGIVLERLKEFDRRERGILVQAAVIGRRFNADFVARTLGLTVDSLSPVLARARDGQLIVEVPETLNEYDFRHALIREAIYEELLSSQARNLHQKIAQALEQLPEPRSVSDLAYHWWKAVDVEKSAHYNEQAGDLAFGVHADEDAVVYYERALETLQRRIQQGSQNDELIQAGFEQHMAQLRRKIGNALFRLGRPDDALLTYQTALNFYRKAKDLEALWQAYRNVARSLYNAGRPKDAIGALRDAVAALSEESESEQADQARALMANFLSDSALYPEALEILQDVKRESLLRDDDLRFLVHHTRAAAYAAGGRLDQWRIEAQGVLDAAPGVREQGTLIGFFDETALTASNVGDRELAERFFEMSLEKARQKSIAAFVSVVAIDYAFEKYLRGQLQQARELLEEAESLEQDMAVVGIRLSIAALAVGSACGDEHLITRCFDVESIEQAFSSGKADFFGPLAGLYAKRLAQQGNTNAAEALLHRAAERLKLLYATFPLVPIIGAYGSRADVERLRPLIEASDASPCPVPHAARTLFEAYAEQRFGGPAEMRKTADSAARAFRELGWPLYEAAALALAGEDRLALGIYRRLGAVGEARRLELKATQTIPPSGDKHGSLSKREREVAHLISLGKGNRMIASELRISEKTVEHHVTSILEKSGFGSRTELAAYIAALERRQ